MENPLVDNYKASAETVNSKKSILHIGAVSFFNARPLIYGLEDIDGLDLQLQVPSRLGGLLDSGRIQVGLVPSIDYQSSRRQWRIIPGIAIGSHDEVLTVRVFSRVPPEELDEIYCDSDSHTSTVLARIIWRVKFGKTLRIIPSKPPVGPAAIMLIGDKVLNQLGKWPREFDLGQAWKEITGLPFIYAFWAVDSTADVRPLIHILQEAKQGGLDNIEDIVSRYSRQHGFSTTCAREYLTGHISYHMGKQELAGLRRFYQLAYELQIIPRQRMLEFAAAAE